MVEAWYDSAMRTTIDGAGRVVIPKSMRDVLGLTGGSEVDIQIDGVGIRIDNVAGTGGPTLREVDGFLVAFASEGAPPLTAELVNQVRDEIRDERLRG